MTKLFVHAKLLIDGISATPKFDQLISIEDDKIKAIEDYHEIQENVIEVNTITPGFFNCHVHILYPVGFDSKKEFSLIEKIFYAQKHCNDYLESGVTFIRVVGTEENYDLQIKEAIQNDVIQGPHMYCAGKVICMTGGHGWQEGIEADGKDGCFLDEECLELMKKQNTFLVPTLCAPQCIIDKGIENGVAKYMVDKTLKVKDAHVKSVKKAYKQGIQIALGTDAGTPFNYHNNTAYEMELLARLNIPNMDILKIATINSARCVGVEKDYGSIEVGKQADLVCLEENPLENISNVRKINRVIQSGKIVVENN